MINHSAPLVLQGIILRCKKTSAYLATYDGTIYANGTHTVIGTVLVRTSNKLTATQQKELEQKVIDALTRLEQE